MNNYSIWVLEYANVPQMATGLFVYGAYNAGTRKMPYCYVVIKGHGQTTMVDVGYNHRLHGEVLATRYGVENWQAPRVVLSECDIAPEDVKCVFITHAHFDHMGNTDAFPNATFYIQERELSKWIWAMSLERRFRWLLGGIDTSDIMRVVDLARQGRLICVNGSRENVLPGIDLCAAFDTHTWGSMYVRVRNDLKTSSADTYILAGDLVYAYENMRGHDASDREYIPIGNATGSQSDLIQTTEAMLAAVGHDDRRIIPVHEDRLRDVFPSRIAANGLRITEVALADGDRSRVR